MSPDARDPETYAIIGAAMEVHTVLGQGFLEGVYQDALEYELIERRISYLREQPIPVLYKGRPLTTPYRDFVCYSSIIVELKTIKQLTEIEKAQVLHYLKATGYKRALLINFSGPELEWKRFIRSAAKRFGSFQSITILSMHMPDDSRIQGIEPQMAADPRR
ncbi:MAG: GxxExxY protein [Pirellulales bacterium]